MDLDLIYEICIMPNMGKLIDITGRVVGKWTVLRRANASDGMRGWPSRWLCRCVCGTEKFVDGQSLRNSLATHCGCSNGNRKHGLAKSPEFIMHAVAKYRAKARLIPFTISPYDINIPTHCPVLGIPLFKSPSGRRADNSPSLDRIRPELGYVPGNIRVISDRANRLKSDATLEESRLIYEYQLREHKISVDKL